VIKAASGLARQATALAISSRETTEPDSLGG
jgi:hypothetical protein